MKNELSHKQKQSKSLKNQGFVHMGERLFVLYSGEHEAYRIRYQNEIWHEIADKIGFCLEYHTFILSYEGDMNVGWLFFWKNIFIYISCNFQSTGVFQSHITVITVSKQGDSWQFIIKHRH